MDKQEPPTTIREVGIHVAYVRDELHKLSAAVQKMGENLATKAELSAIEKRVKALEDRNDLKNTLFWMGLAVSVIINIIAAYQSFTGN